MLRITISKSGVAPRTRTFDKREITVGRTASNDLVISEPGVSSAHARILYMEGAPTIIDLESTNGTYVNGERIQAPHVLSPADEVFICAHRLEFDWAGAAVPLESPQAGALANSFAAQVSGEISDAPPWLEAPAYTPVPAEANLSVSANGPDPNRNGAPTLPPLLAPEAAPDVASSDSVVVSALVSPDAPIVEPMFPASVLESAPVPDLVGPTELASVSEPAAVAPSLSTPESTPAPHIPSEPRSVVTPSPRDSAQSARAPQSIDVLASPIPDSQPASRLPLFELERLPDLRGPALEREVCRRVFAIVCQKLSPGGALPPNDASTRARARTEALRCFEELAQRVPGIDVRPWTEHLISELCGHGALCAPLAEHDVREIFVHGLESITIRRADGSVHRTRTSFSCLEAIETVIRRLTGTRFDAHNPIVDGYTNDGTRVYGVHQSIAGHRGPVVSITSASVKEPRASLEHFIADGAISPVIANLLSTCVQASLNIALCAAPGASAFPLLCALAEVVDPTERQVLVLPAQEPGGLPPNVIVLAGNHGISNDTGTMQALVRMALGLRPQRLLVHGICGHEASDTFAAMGRPLSGSVISTRAINARDGLVRLANLVELSGSHADSAPAARFVAQSLELVVSVARFQDGVTRVTEIAEPRITSGSAEVDEIFRYDLQRRQWCHTGVIPTFFAELQRRGFDVDPEMLASTAEPFSSIHSPM